MPSLGPHGLRIIPRPHEPTTKVVRKEKLSTVGFFGAQRIETGQAIVDTLAAACLDIELEVILQNSHLTSIEEPNQPKSGIRRYGFVHDLAALMSKADLVVLPYLSRGYEKRYSGVGGLAVSCGIPVLAPAGTGIAKMLMQYETGATFSDNSVSGIMTQLQKVRADYPLYADRAFKAASQWATENGLARHVDQLTGRIS
jgi:glycosyltransferase involved in cell wall biosynthesis